MYKINKYIFFTTLIFYFSCSTKENGRYFDAINSNRIICREYFNNNVPSSQSLCLTTLRFSQRNIIFEVALVGVFH